MFMNFHEEFLHLKFFTLSADSLNDRIHSGGTFCSSWTMSHERSPHGKVTLIYLG